jgi:hypothetical protein
MLKNDSRRHKVLFDIFTISLNDFRRQGNFRKSSKCIPTFKNGFIEILSHQDTTSVNQILKNITCMCNTEVVSLRGMLTSIRDEDGFLEVGYSGIKPTSKNRPRIKVRCKP